MGQYTPRESRVELYDTQPMSASAAPMRNVSTISDQDTASIPTRKAPRHQPSYQQDGAEIECAAGHPMRDRHRHGERPAIDRKMRRKRAPGLEISARHGLSADKNPAAKLRERSRPDDAARQRTAGERRRAEGDAKS